MSAPRPGDLLGARYVLVDVLGEGSSATVYRARDRWRDTEVAVKVLRGAEEAERRAIARREHALGRDLAHPALVSALDAGSFDAHPFVVLDLALGEPLDVALDGADPRSLAQVVDALASALAALHARGVVHGDLKPTNVRVARRDQQLEVRLLDLGCARPPGTAGGGTLAYAAPEAIGGAVSCVSDLFSLGVVAWEAATGALPFGDPSDPAYLARLARAELSSSTERVPAALEPILRRLLAQDPAARYGSAGELRSALRTVVELPEHEEAPPAPPLLEREGLLDALRDHVSAIAREGAAPLFVRGVAGTGRSRLLARAAAEARIEGACTLEVSARASLREWLRALVDRAARSSGIDAGTARAAIDAEVATPEGRHAPLFAVLRVLELTAASAPLVIFVDDAEHAAPTVREALHFLAAARPHATRVGWVIADAPSEEPGLRVDPLGEASVASLIASLVPGVDGADALARLAVARTGGVAGAVVEGTRALVEGGVIRFVAGQWRSAAEGVPAWAYEQVGEAWVERAIARLGADARQTLASLALIGGSVEMGAARLGLAGDSIDRASAMGLRAGVLRRTGTGHELASRGMRERLVADLDDETRHALRRRALDALAGASDLASRAERARHLAALGHVGEAAGEALATGLAAAACGELHEAVELLEQAERHGSGASVGAAALALGNVRASLGQIDAALDALERARRAGMALEAVTRARGGVLARAGRYEEAIAALGQLEARGALDARDRFWLGWSFMMRGSYEDAARLAIVGDGSHADRARLGRLAGTIAWHKGELGRARDVLHAAKEAADASCDPLVRAEVEQSLGTAERLGGNLDGAAAHYAIAIELAREGGFAALLAKVLNNLAIAEYQAGRWEAARHAWESMQELATRLDAQEEILLAHNNLALLFQDRGELDRAGRALDAAIVIARRERFARYEAMALGNRAEVHVRAGRLALAELDLEAADTIARRIGAEDERRECRRRRVTVRLARGDASGALAAALAAAEEASSAGAHAEVGHAYLVASAAARALGRIDEAGAHVASASASWERGATRLDRARLELERARVRLAAGDRREAVRIARRAGKAFAEVGAEPELAAVRAIEDADVSVDRGEALLAILQVAGEEADAAALLDRVLDRIVTLTGAERGVVITFRGDEEPRVAARRGGGGADPIVSRGIADRAIASRRALVLADVEDESELAGRESVVRLGVRAALCAPLLQGDACLGLLYVDSTHGPELVRFGLWVVDAAAAILAPALARLTERDAHREREALLRSATIDALETVSAIDSALDLVADSATTPADAKRLALVRARCGELLGRSTRLLELMRVDARQDRSAPTSFSVRTLVASALEAFEGSNAPHVELAAEGVAVLGVLEPLASAVARMMESGSSRSGAPTTVRVYVTAEGRALPRERTWRPGASAGRRFVRIEVDGGAEDPFEPDAGLPLRAARRIAARAGGRLFVTPAPLGGRIVMELEAMEARS